MRVIVDKLFRGLYFVFSGIEKESFAPPGVAP